MEFKVRNPKASDVPRLQELCRKYRNAGFVIPEGNVFADQVVEVDGQVVAYGLLKMIAEAILVMDHSMPQKVKVQALKLLIQEAVKAADAKQIKELQAVCEDPFASVMKKQFGFQQLQGETLILDL